MFTRITKSDSAKTGTATVLHNDGVSFTQSFQLEYQILVDGFIFCVVIKLGLDQSRPRWCVLL